MVTVGNQGRDDRYIRLWRSNISLPAVSRSCDCHVFDNTFRSIDFLMRTKKAIRQIKEGIVFFIPGIIYNFFLCKIRSKFCFHLSSTKSPCKRLSTQDWFRSHAHARLAFLKAICSKIFHSRFNFFRCCNISSLWNLNVAVRAVKK